MATQLLLADDSPTIAKILQMSLQNEAYEIRAVLTAEEALKELRANPPYFFLVDLTLPGKNGYEFARFIKGDSKLNGVRVVLLASAFEPVDETEYQACGADAVVKKPFDPGELRAKLKSIMDAPPKFPKGSKVSGSLSGFEVIREKTITFAGLPSGTAPPTAGQGLPPPGAPALPTGAPAGLVPPTSAAPPSSPDDLALPMPGPEDDIASLLQGNVEAPTGAHADAILAGLLSGDPNALPMPEADAAAEMILESAAHAPATAGAAEPPTDLDLVQAEPAADFSPGPAIEGLLLTREEPAAPSTPTAPAKPAAPSPLDIIKASREPAPVENPERGNATVALDLSGTMDSVGNPETVLDLSSSFNTPPGGTAMIDMAQFGEAMATAQPVATAQPIPKPAPAPAPKPAAPEPPAGGGLDDLSANAQALAAFFSAEIQTQTSIREPTQPAMAQPSSMKMATPAAPPAAKPAPAPAKAPGPVAPAAAKPKAPEAPSTPLARNTPAAPTPTDSDSFDASLDSIDWGTGPAEASLSGWSSGSLKPKAAPQPSQAPTRGSISAAMAGGGGHAAATGGQAVATGATQATVKTSATKRVASAAGGKPSLMFDTAGSTFRFAEDYVTRITKSFTGHFEETIPETAAAPAPMFANQSDDRPPPPPSAARAPLTGGGAWSEQDVAKIEQIVREEVQMVVREVAEKIAWEVIPELAENLIKKELEKVLKEMEQ